MIFNSLPCATLSALQDGESASAVNSAEDARQNIDVGEDDTYAPIDALNASSSLFNKPQSGTVLSGGDETTSAVVKSDVEHDSDDACSSDASNGEVRQSLEELKAWAFSKRAARVDLTARLQPRSNSNTKHAETAVCRADRAEDRRRESIAKDKVDRATVEQVLDPRTRMILFRLLSRGRLTNLDGCVSTGKEANVYYGTAPPNCRPPDETYPDNLVTLNAPHGRDSLNDLSAGVEHVAVKVFKTSILSFKDRERYVAGEFRFRRGGYNRSSNRKMVQQWAEKEYRNLMRLQEAGVPSPIPYIIKPPVLVMSFFGRDGWPSPRLKDAGLSADRLTDAYRQVCIVMRRIFKRAKLVHGDLSEYNLLYDRGSVVVIDVSQSVEDDHPMALDFLRRDCANVNDYFRRNGVFSVLGLRELFDFVTAESGDLESDDALVQRFNECMDAASQRSEEQTDQLHLDDVVFSQAFIPRTLDEVPYHENDVQIAMTEGTDDLLYAKITGLSLAQNIQSKRQHTASPVHDSSQSDDDSQPSESTSDDNHSSSASSDHETEEDVSPEQAKAARKEHKKTVKAAARERRENKTPKHVKKRKSTLARRRKGMKARK